MADSGKSLESWIWDAACSIRGAKDAPKYKEFILPLIFAKRLCDVFDDELNRIAKEVGSRAKAFAFVKHDKKLVRFYLPLEPINPDDAVWSAPHQALPESTVVWDEEMHRPLVSSCGGGRV
jgi:type I restriction enzyme M protein